MKLPLVSVLMPVYNAEAYLSSAIQSILSQTHTDFELIIVDDGSTDTSLSICQSFAAKDKRIKLIINTMHVGINACMNTAIAQAKGSFLARMDADDISLPKRLETQVKYLRRHADMVAVGGNFFVISHNGQLIGKRTFPQKFSDIYSYTSYFVAISQPAMMIARKRLPKNFVFFDPKTIWADDVELIFKLFMHGKVGNVKQTILLYRMREDSHSLKNPKQTFYHTLKFRVKAVWAYNYHPPIKGVLINLAQLFLVTVLPNKHILALYKKLRNQPIIPEQKITVLVAIKQLSLQS